MPTKFLKQKSTAEVGVKQGNLSKGMGKRKLTWLACILASGLIMSAPSQAALLNLLSTNPDLSSFNLSASLTVAFDASSGAFALGSVGRSPDELDLALEAVLVEVNGVIVDSATGAAVQGHPGEALALAANELAKRGLAIEAGWIVLTGGMTDAVYSQPKSSVACHFTSLGSIFISGGP